MNRFHEDKIIVINNPKMAVVRIPEANLLGKNQDKSIMGYVFLGKPRYVLLEGI